MTHPFCPLFWWQWKNDGHGIKILLYKQISRSIRSIVSNVAKIMGQRPTQKKRQFPTSRCRMRIRSIWTNRYDTFTLSEKRLRGDCEWCEYTSGSIEISIVRACLHQASASMLPQQWYCSHWKQWSHSKMGSNPDLEQLHCFQWEWCCQHHFRVVAALMLTLG